MEITNRGKVESLYGYWPEFADAKINKITIDNRDGSNATIELILTYIDSDKNIKAIIQILFSGVFNVSLSEMTEQNIIDQLAINEVNSDYLVELEACYGMHGQFNCKEVEVVTVNA